MDPTMIEKNEFDAFFPQEFAPSYSEDMLSFGFANPDALAFNALNISNQLSDFYPQTTIAPSALGGSPKAYPPLTAQQQQQQHQHQLQQQHHHHHHIQQLHHQQLQQQQHHHQHQHQHPLHRQSSPEDSYLNLPRDSSASPSSSENYHPLPQATAPAPSHIPTAVLAQQQQQQPAMIPLHIHANLSSSSLSRSSEADGSPTVVGRGLRESPRARATSPEPKLSPKRNGGGLVDRHQRARAASSAALPAAPTTRATRARGSRKVKEEEDWTEFDEDDDFAPSFGNGDKPERRREDIRRQRIESEQRRRDELREGYNRLRSALPPSNQKSSKASILERATVCITDLNHKTGGLASRVDELEAELRRVRVLNETLMLSAAEHRTAAAAAQYAAAQAGVHLPAHAVGFQQA